MPPPQRDKSFTIAAAILFSVGALFAVLWLIVTVPALRLAAHGQSAQATYVDSISHTSSRGGSLLRPRFRFRTPAGQAIIVTSTASSTEESYSDGDTVRVLYDPNDPTNARIDTLSNLWIGTLVVGLIMAFFFGMGSIFWFVRRR